jgi:hypothetical protein
LYLFFVAPGGLKTKSMKPILMLLLVLLSININAQIKPKIDFSSKNSTTAFFVAGSAVTFYGFLKEKNTRKEYNQSVMLCTSGILLASFPVFADFFEKNHIKIGCEGITYTLKFPKKYKRK